MAVPSGRTGVVAALAGAALGFTGALGGLVLAQGAPGECRPEASPHSVARQWDEAALDAVRRDLPAPTVHARNLFHLSVAMWDAWAAYDESARGYLVDENRTAGDAAAARDEAISYAKRNDITYRVIEPHEPKRRQVAYADNFRYDRRQPWTH